MRMTVPAGAQQPGMRHMVAELRRVVRGETQTHAILRSRLLFLLIGTLLLDAAATVLMYLFERGHDRSEISNMGDALFWVTAQLTTVSSQMANPVTTPGRVLDVVLEVWAISVVATLAASLASFFRTRHVETVMAERHQT
jgi:hypothetical protein